MNSEDFFRIVNVRNTDKETGQPIDCNLLQRMQHPYCLKCQEEYRKKHPGQPFKIQCEGVWEDEELREIAETPDADLTFEQAKEIKNACYWAEQHIKLTDDNGQKQPFKARPYQEEILRCTAMRKVDRLARGLGKTTLGYIEELHILYTRRNHETVVVTPRKAQAQKWFTDMKAHIYADDDLRRSLVGTPKQAPYFEFVVSNGSNIRIFCAGASEGETLRAQSPRRTRMDEQDYLNEEDYKAIQPFFRRYKNSEVHGSSTPTGARGMYWKMCKKLMDYREFHFPIHHHPDWSEEMEEACRAEARTELTYTHEYEAEFGEMLAGVFKPEYIDSSLRDYAYAQCSRVKNDTCSYFMGVDWNGGGTGTKIRIVAFDPKTKIRRVVDSRSVDKSVMDSLHAIRDMNRRWRCEEIYIDAGYGHAQDELLRLMGKKPQQDADKTLLDVKRVDFGASLKFNKFVPNRDKRMYVNDEDNELERRTKPFLVEGMQMVVEAGLFEFSRHDTVLEEQMRAYRVKNYSSHGWANVYITNEEIGDHDLDAVMLACLGIELKYGLFYEHRRQNRIASGFEYLSSFGSNSTASVASSPVDAVQARLTAAQVPSRTTNPNDQTQARMDYLGRHSLLFRPAQPSGPGRWGNMGPGSRTAPFANRPTKRRF